jgi:hypothetical protein
MFRALTELFTPKPKPVPPLELARKIRRSAAEAYADACERKDCRDMHTALKRYAEATNTVLRLERGLS